MRRRRMIGTTTIALAMGLLFAPKGVQAQTASKGEAPKLFADISSSTRVYPNADAALTGFALGSLYKPSDKCVHLAGEILCPLWAQGWNPRGSQNADRWGSYRCALGPPATGTAGLGRARCSTSAGVAWARQNKFVSSAYLRALLYWRLRGEFWLGLDVRAGYVIAPVTVGGVGIKGPLLGLGIGVSWGKDEDEYAPEPEATL